MNTHIEISAHCSFLRKIGNAGDAGIGHSFDPLCRFSLYLFPPTVNLWIVDSKKLNSACGKILSNVAVAFFQFLSRGHYGLDIKPFNFQKNNSFIWSSNISEEHAQC